LRIIAGSARGRKLKAPRGMDTRPTSDRVKEAIFNVLSSKILDSRVLDVFAGTGALGIEALSRGAKEAVFIEKRRQAWELIKENLTISGFGDRAQVYLSDFTNVLAKLTGKFDIVFLDPPYGKGLVQPAVSCLIEFDLLHSDVVVVLETGSKQKELPAVEGIEQIKTSVYGDTAVFYYQLKRGELSNGGN